MGAERVREAGPPGARTTGGGAGDPTEFADREEVGRRLAQRLASLRGTNALILALPRGGVVIGAPIAERLGLPMDVLIVRKIGHPTQPEFGLGAVVEGLPPVFDTARLVRAGLTEADLAATVRLEEQEVERRARRYRDGRGLADVRGRTVVIVDDGVATGGTVRAAIRALRRRRPRRIVLAVGVAPAEAVAILRDEVDELVCLAIPVDFSAVGESYRDFRPVSDDRVVALLHRSGRPGSGGTTSGTG